MAKISQASSKYIIKADIDIEGVVDRPDVVGAIFGQIEGLLGADLELRELQRSGRIGRIEVNVTSKDGKTQGNIIIPSSLDKAETAIVAGALEIIERIGPCNANIKVTSIHDERIAKRQQVINRAKQLLKTLDNTIPDSQELSSEVVEGLRVMEITPYGLDKLPAGPDIELEDEVIFVEGRADVVNLLKHGFRNVIGINGTSIPDTVKELSKTKTVTLFTDGDRGGDLIIKEMLAVAHIDYITKAPDGKEVEELQKKEIHQALRNKIKAENWDTRSWRERRDEKKPQTDAPNERKTNGRRDDRRTGRRDDRRDDRRTGRRDERPPRRDDRSYPRAPRISQEEKELFQKYLKELRGHSSYVLDMDNNVLGKLSIKDLAENLPHLTNVGAVIVGGELNEEVAAAIDKVRPRTLVVTTPGAKTRQPFLTKDDL